MIIHSAVFVKSCPSLRECPVTTKPEFAFIGRSNVGKSSLINMLTGRKALAKTSVKPGKTRSINYFIINNEWYIVDLPGYGYAKVSADLRDKWLKATWNYIVKRENLVLLFVLIDVRIKPQKSDLEFMEALGNKQIPFARVFTKCDKISKSAVKRAVMEYDRTMLTSWESLPPTFIALAETGTGKDDLLNHIRESINIFSNVPVNKE